MLGCGEVCGSVEEVWRDVRKYVEVWGKARGNMREEIWAGTYPGEAAGSEAPLLTDTDIYLQWTQ